MHKNAGVEITRPEDCSLVDRTSGFQSDELAFEA